MSTESGLENMCKRGLKTEPCGTPRKKEAEDDEKV